MYKRSDAMSYDTFTYIEDEPRIQLSKDNLYGGFALEIPNNYSSFINETIYYPKAYFKRVRIIPHSFLHFP